MSITVYLDRSLRQVSSLTAGTNDSAAHERLACEPHSSEGSHSSWLGHRDEMVSRLCLSTYCEGFVNELPFRGSNIPGMVTAEPSNRRTIIDNPYLSGASTCRSMSDAMPILRRQERIPDHTGVALAARPQSLPNASSNLPHRIASVGESTPSGEIGDLKCRCHAKGIVLVEPHDINRKLKALQL